MNHKTNGSKFVYKVTSTLIVCSVLIFSFGCASKESHEANDSESVVTNETVLMEEGDKGIVSDELVEFEPDPVMVKSEKIAQFEGIMNLDEIKGNYSDFSKADIRVIQNSLNEHGYDAGAVDGALGNKTIMAVVSMQYDNNLKLSGAIDKIEFNVLGIKEVMEVVVKYKSASMAYNNSVGNDWWTSFYVDEKDVNRGSTYSKTINKGGSIKIIASAGEVDKVPDVGSDRKTYSYSELVNLGNESRIMDVYVIENRGRYSGNDAKWVFKYSITCSVKLE